MGNGFDNAQQHVLVVDADRQFVEYVSPAVARRALKDGVATVFRKQPFSIQLPPGVTRCPRTFAKARRVRKMSMGINNWSKFFEDEKSIWVKSLVPGQVSLEFKDAMGNITGVVVPYSGDPVNLTDRVSLDQIRTSTDLRTLSRVRRQRGGGVKPPAIQVLTEEEALEHFKKKAERKKLYKTDPLGKVLKDGDGNPVLDIEAASTPKVTEPATRASAGRVDLPESKTQRDAAAADEVSSVRNTPVMLADAIQPRVMHLCHQVASAENENERPLAADLIEELESIPMTEDDLNHVLAMGYYKSVKTWAREQLADMVASEE